MARPHRLDHAPFLVPPGRRIHLEDYDPGYRAGFEDKDEAEAALRDDAAALAEAQERLWARAQYAVLIILQAPDAAGKDSLIKHVMATVNPQGCVVHSFKAPTEEELKHHFLWRPAQRLPARGDIAIFNRSYYEEVLVVRVHPELLERQRLPPATDLARVWSERFEDINAFERHLARSGTAIIKFFLNVSRREQKKRFLERLTEPEKHWKWSAGDLRERARWRDYRRAYEDMLNATSTEWAPWHVLPADRKWFTRAGAADIIAARIEALGLEFPKLSPDQARALAEAKRQLEQEPDD